MKRLTLAAILFVCMVAVSFAADFGAPTGKVVNVVFAPETTATIFDASSSTHVALASTDAGFTGDKRTCFVTTGATAPTSVAVKVYGSIDNSTFVNLASHTYTVASADTRMFHIVNKPVRWLKGEFVGKVGGDATTTVEIACTNGGN